MGTIGIVRHAASKGERYWERQVRHFSRSVAKRAHIARGNPAVVAGEHPLFALTTGPPRSPHSLQRAKPPRTQRATYLQILN